MNKGDLVEMKSRPAVGVGIIIGFEDIGIPNHYPWVKVYWGKCNRIDTGPMSYFSKVTK